MRTAGTEIRTWIPKPQAATLVVAASDSLRKERADYVCPGVADNVEIQRALDALPAAGGEVVLLDGTYNIAAEIVMDSYQTVRGCGRNTFLTTAAGIAIFETLGGAGTEKIGMVLRDLALDGQAQSGGYGVYWDYCDSFLITNIWVDGFATAGLYIYRSDNNLIEGCFINGSWEGIWLFNSTHNSITGNYCEGADDAGIFLDAGATHNIVSGNVCTLNDVGIETSAEYNAITGNTASANTWCGIFVFAGYYCTVSGNTCEGNALQGIEVYQGSYNTIVGNMIYNTAGEGIEVDQADYCTVVGNTIARCDTHGILLDNADNNLVACNDITESSQGTDNTYDGIFLMISDDNLISNNLIRMGALANQPRYGINISTATCNRNRVLDNDLYNSGLTAPFNDAAVDTKLAAFIVPFSDGTDPQDSGYEIDVAGEYARAWLRLPSHVNQVMKMKVYARSVVAEVHEMELEMVVKGGADNEGYGTHDGSIAQLDSASVNFAADDIIHWVNTEAGVLALVGGDSVEVKVLHEAAEGDNCETDAFFRTVEIEYV